MPVEPWLSDDGDFAKVEIEPKRALEKLGGKLEFFYVGRGAREIFNARGRMLTPRDQMLQFKMLRRSPIWRKMDIPGIAQIQRLGQCSQSKLKTFPGSAFERISARKPD